jgi:hypothetical protein
MDHHWRDSWICETVKSQQVVQFHNSYMKMMMMEEEEEEDK